MFPVRKYKQIEQRPLHRSKINVIYFKPHKLFLEYIEYFGQSIEIKT